jgi:hypothetical protein
MIVLVAAAPEALVVIAAEVVVEIVAEAAVAKAVPIIILTSPPTLQRHPHPSPALYLTTKF